MRRVSCSPIQRPSWRTVTSVTLIAPATIGRAPANLTSGQPPPPDLLLQQLILRVPVAIVMGLASGLMLIVLRPRLERFAASHPRITWLLFSALLALASAMVYVAVAPPRMPELPAPGLGLAGWVGVFLRDVAFPLLVALCVYYLLVLSRRLSPPSDRGLPPPTVEVAAFVIATLNFLRGAGNTPLREFFAQPASWHFVLGNALMAALLFLRALFAGEPLGRKLTRPARLWYEVLAFLMLAVVTAWVVSS